MIFDRFSQTLSNFRLRGFRGGKAAFREAKAAHRDATAEVRNGIAEVRDGTADNRAASATVLSGNAAHYKCSAKVCDAIAALMDAIAAARAGVAGECEDNCPRPLRPSQSDELKVAVGFSPRVWPAVDLVAERWLKAVADGHAVKRR